MEQFIEEKGLHWSVLSELKSLGVKVPKVKKLKGTVSKQDKTIENSRKIFGASLSEQEWVTDSDCPLPKFVAAATGYLKTYTKAEVGLFRKAGSVVRQRELRAKLEGGGNFLNCEPNDVASLLKQWLRELPEPVIPMHLHDLFIRCQSLDYDEDRLNAILLSCLLLPAEHLYTLKHLLKFLKSIAASSEVNKMSIHNLALIMAPNLLPCGNNNSNKSSNIMQSCTSVVEILIANADKVGSVPPKIADQLMSGENSDLTIETLCCSPSKMKKKLKNGTGGGNVVVDLVSGIKKIVGGNITPMNTCMDFADVVNSVKSSTRRKNAKENTSETPFFTPVAEISRLAAPSNGLNLNTPLSHFRRKSFGLLNKKRGKRAKSVKPNISDGTKECCSVLKVITPSAPSIVVVNTVIMNKEIKEQENGLIVPLVGRAVPNFRSCEDTTIKRAVSDCPLSTKKIENQKRCSSSLSMGSLPAKRPSPLNMDQLANLKRKSRKTVDAAFDKDSVKQCSEKRTDDCCSVILKNGHQKFIAENKKQDLKRNASVRRSSRSINRLKSAEERVSLKSSQDGSVLRKQPSQSRVRKCSSSSSIKSSCKNSEKATTKNSEIAEGCDESQIVNFKVVNVFVDTPIKIHKDNRINTTPVSVEKHSLPGSVKKCLNKSSLKRGRPNTIKTGLPSELCPKYNNDLSHSKLERSVTSVGSKTLVGIPINEFGNTSAITHAQDIVGDAFVYSKDDSIINYSTPENSSLGIGEICEVVKDASYESIPFQPEFSVTDLSCVQTPKQNSRKNSGHKTRKSQKQTKNDTSILLSPCYIVDDEVVNEKSKRSPDSIVKGMDFSECLENSSFDKENVYPGKEIWHSEAESFLNSHLIPKETQCKRESIIQIIANNAGKVKENVQHYNHIAKEKKHGSFKEISNNSRSTPRREIKRTLTEFSSISPDLYNSKSLASPRMCTRSCSQNLPIAEESSVTSSQLKRNVKSLLPPPPKFVLSHSDKSGSSTPLKEVTNLKGSKKNSNSSSKNFKISSSPAFIEKTTPLSEGSKMSSSKPIEKNPVIKRFKRKSRLSYEESPSRITKESRSESSPVLVKTDHSYSLRLRGSPQSPLLRKRFQSQSFTSPLDIPPSRSVSTVSIRDINDLKNAQVIDAWECKM